MKFWILLSVALALLIWSLMREHLENYDEALAEVGQVRAYNPPPICPVGTIMRSEDGKCVSSTSSASPMCATGYELKEDKKCHRTGGTETAEPTCPAGFEYNSSAARCDTSPVEPTCPGGYTYRNRRCETNDPSGSAMTDSEAAPADGMTSGAAGSTTGGSSTSSWGPNSGGSSNRLRQVFGPQFTSKGDGDSGDGGDSSKTNVYPELLGGRIDTSSRIPGAGIQSPSKNWTLTKDGSLPPTNTTGSDPMSQYFPFSRTPGDMDIIPDPYRVAKTFSSSSYSSKTEPVPFLTDFSAFQR